jgi:tetratricopeptide (TPR) repeat protein
VLFDLRSPRRRAAIKVIYSMLAILMGGGLIFFGIGSDATGGLADIFGEGGGGGSTFDDQIEDAEKQVEETPRDQAALLELVSLYLQAGGQQLDVDPETGATLLTTDAEASYIAAADAWARYLRLEPKKPDPTTALLLANSSFVIAQNSSTAADAQGALENAAEFQQVAAEGNPIPGNLANLALYLYFAGRFAEADRVAARAIAKAPPNERKAQRKQLEDVEKQARQFQKQVEAEAKGAGTGTNPLEDPSGLGGLGGALSTP